MHVNNLSQNFSKCHIKERLDNAATHCLQRQTYQSTDIKTSALFIIMPSTVAIIFFLTVNLYIVDSQHDQNERENLKVLIVANKTISRTGFAHSNHQPICEINRNTFTALITCNKTKQFSCANSPVQLSTCKHN